MFPTIFVCNYEYLSVIMVRIMVCNCVYLIPVILDRIMIWYISFYVVIILVFIPPQRDEQKHIIPFPLHGIRGSNDQNLILTPPSHSCRSSLPATAVHELCSLSLSLSTKINKHNHVLCSFLYQLQSFVFNSLSNGSTFSVPQITNLVTVKLTDANYLLWANKCVLS